MLRLHSATPPEWTDRVAPYWPELLIDHAHCEKKAASTAMNLVFAYVEHEPLVRALLEIVEEELSHFRLVLDLLAERGVKFRRLRPSAYGARLAKLIRPGEPARGVDRLLVAGLIEARSCERFGLLRDRLPDRELAEFYGSLFESEARHHATYLRLACLLADEAQVFARLEELAASEAAIVAEPEPLVRVHSLTVTTA